MLACRSRSHSQTTGHQRQHCRHRRSSSLAFSRSGPHLPLLRHPRAPSPSLQTRCCSLQHCLTTKTKLGPIHRATALTRAIIPKILRRRVVDRGAHNHLRVTVANPVRVTPAISCSISPRTFGLRCAAMAQSASLARTVGSPTMEKNCASRLIHCQTTSQLSTSSSGTRSEMHRTARDAAATNSLRQVAQMCLPLMVLSF